MRRHLRLIAAYGLSGLAALFAVCEIIDPYHENDMISWRMPFGFASRVLSSQSLLHELGRGPHILVFGTSRSAMVSAAATGAPTLNLYPLYGNPKAVLGFLERIPPAAQRNVIEIFYLLDHHTLCEGCFIEDVDYTSPLPRFMYKITHLPQTVRRLPLDILRNLKGALGKPMPYRYEDGALLDFGEGVHNGQWVQVPPTPQSLPISDFQPETLARLKAVDDLIRARGWTVHYYRPTLPRATVALLDPERLEQQRKALLGVIPSFHDLTDVEGISDNPTLFGDATHINITGARYQYCALRAGIGRVTSEEATRSPVVHPSLPASCRLAP